MQKTQSPSSSLVRRIYFSLLDDKGLARLSEKKLLSLSLEEMQVIQRYFRSQRREPTDVELETIAQTWSEHCKHKTFRGKIEYTELPTPNSQLPTQTKVYNDLLKETIVRATQELNKPFCLSVFKDNAGILSFDKKWALVFKVETHNHPSALEPYGGAGTGLGGVIRDILGAGLGAKPLLNTDIFCVGELKPSLASPLGSPPFQWGVSEATEGLKGVDYIPPEKILSGAVAGVRDYGNRMGIPTANGAVFFHAGFKKNPLVFCGSVGLIPKDKIKKKTFPGDLIVSIGGKTGRDGIHGATFSSLSLKENLPSSLVQIGNAIVEKKVMDVILRARDKNLYHAITDCGAGGYSSAVGEMAAHCGAKVFLEKVPLKYAGMTPWEIWLSESQERMVLAVPVKNLKAFQSICDIENVECSVIGEFANDKKLKVYFKKELVCNLDLEFLHEGVPQIQRKAVWIPPHPHPLPQGERIKVRVKNDCAEILKKLLSHPNIASKKWLVRQYDHEVQAGSVVKPFSGSNGSAPNDACVFRPHLDSWSGVVVSNGLNPLYGEIDPYWMAANAIDEALRNLTAVGGTLRHCAFLDNFCWGDVNDPEILGGLVRCAQGCYDFSKEFGVPFISGKDSLNNTWQSEDGRTIPPPTGVAKSNSRVAAGDSVAPAGGGTSSIPGTLLISAIGVIRDVRKCVTADFKSPGNVIALIGETKEEFGGSHFNLLLGRSGGEVPKVNAQKSKKSMLSIFQAIDKGWVRSCHDLSEGGLAVALSEMCIGGELGAEIHIPYQPTIPPPTGGGGKRWGGEGELAFLFSESASRWLIEIEPKNFRKVKKLFSNSEFQVIGRVTKKPVLKIYSNSRRARAGENPVLFQLSVSELSLLWNNSPLLRGVSRL